MIPQGKGPTESTPSRLGGSIDKQAAAARLADECIEKMQGVVDDAHGFMPAVGALDDADVRGAWRTCWKRVDEWAGMAGVTVTSYQVSLWQIFGNRSEMQSCLKEEWPRFKILLHRLFLQMRGICVEAGERIGDRLPLFRLQSGKILRGPERAEYDIQHRLNEHWRKIRRAFDAPLKDFDAWAAQQRIQNGFPETKTPEPHSAKKRGPDPDNERHRAIAETVKAFGDDWRHDANLEKIAKLLDRNPLTPAPKGWPKRSPPARTWSRATQFHRDVVVKIISYSLKMASKAS